MEAMAVGNVKCGHLSLGVQVTVSQRKQKNQGFWPRCAAQPLDADFLQDAAMAAAAAAVLPAAYWLYKTGSNSSRKSGVVSEDNEHLEDRIEADTVVQAVQGSVGELVIQNASAHAFSLETAAVEFLQHSKVTSVVEVNTDKNGEANDNDRDHRKSGEYNGSNRLSDIEVSLRKHRVKLKDDTADHDSSVQNDRFTYDKLIRAGRIKESLEVLEEMEAKGILDMNTIYHTRFFQECKKRSAVQEAFRFVRLISSPTLSTFNMLLSVCCNAADIEGAFGAFAAMEKAGFKPDCMLYTTLISTCAKARRIDLMFQVFHDMESSSVEPNVHTYGAMIDGCARVGDMAKAFGMYGSMVSKRIKPDIVIFNSLINACARSGAVQRAFEVLHEMKSANLSLQPNHVTMCSLIDACARAGEVDSSYDVYKMMREAGVKATPQVYTAAVHACSHSGDIDRALKIYDDLQSDGIRPDEVFFSALIDVAGHAQSIDKAFDILHEVEKHSIVPGATIFSSLMGVCSNTGNWEKALVLHERIQELGIRPTVSTLNALVTALCRGKQLHDAVRSLQEMKEVGVSANQLTYILLLDACEKENAAEIALDLYARATSEGIPLNLSICSNLIALCLHGVHRRLPPALAPPIGVTLKDQEKPHEQWVSWALSVYRQAVSAGVTLTPKLFSQVLGCLRIPETPDKKFPDKGVFSLKTSTGSWTKQLMDGFGVYDPRASALYEEASAFGIVPRFQCDTGPITFEAEALPVYTAEVCLLTILKALRHRCAIDAQLPSVTIKFDQEMKTISTPDGGIKPISVASRNGQALAALLRRLRLRFNGKESTGRIRLTSAAMQRWFRPSAPTTGNQMESIPSSSILGKNIADQQRAIRMGTPLPEAWARPKPHR